MTLAILKPPYPWYGGKAQVAPVLWKAFGDAPNFVDPFFGGGAALLLRPGYDPIRHTETVNDLDCNIANFWRALNDPEQLAYWADWPVNEVDLHARHQWLVNRTWGADSEFRERMTTDPDFCDYKQAGWWVWGICQWIGGGFCDQRRATVPTIDGNNGQGVHRKLPHLGSNGQGVHRKRPHLGDSGRGIYGYFAALADRTRRVRVCCGDFERVLGPSPTSKLGVTAVLLDPPYDRSIRHSDLYACESDDAAPRARQWAIENGENPRLRIALCGYSEEHTMPTGWWAYSWKASGGYGNQGQGRGRENCEKETIWLSPHCLDFRTKHKQLSLLC